MDWRQVERVVFIDSTWIQTRKILKAFSYFLVLIPNLKQGLLGRRGGISPLPPLPFSSHSVSLPSSMITMHVNTYTGCRSSTMCGAYK